MVDINFVSPDAVQNHNVAHLYRVIFCEFVVNFSILTCLHLYFCCVHSRKFTLCLFTLFSSETFSIMGPIQHGEQLSY